MIKVLDSTLRDGGYIIDWNFGRDNTKSIVKKLVLADIDYIELGFLSDAKTTSERTVFNNLKEAQDLIEGTSFDKFCLMIKSGDLEIGNLKTEKIKTLRYIFKKHQKQKAMEECRELIAKGFKLFINPVFIDEYNKKEFLTLADEISSLNPFALSIVDSMGTMREDDVVSLFLKLDEITDKKTALGFHSHNNIEHAFINAKELIKTDLKREIIIDSCLAGMGRGAGNICSELLAQYLNQKYSKNYKINHLLNIIDNILNDFYEKTPWGNSYPYYICAIKKCHPDYATYLINKNIDNVAQILDLIPDNEKFVFKEELIEEIFSRKNIPQ